MKFINKIGVRPYFQTFSKEELASSKNKKLKEVAKFLNDDSLMERIKSYTERYWDQKWSQIW